MEAEVNVLTPTSQSFKREISENVWKRPHSVKVLYATCCIVYYSKGGAAETEKDLSDLLSEEIKS